MQALHDYTRRLCPEPFNARLDFMDFFILAVAPAAAIYFLKFVDERARVALLASYLARYQIEKLMETLTQGYMRALGEAEPQRRDQVWQQMESTEARLSDQLSRFSTDFQAVAEPDARISKLPLSFPFARKLLPQVAFDMRKALAIHARGIALSADPDDGRDHKSRAFTLSAEMLLMQHSCHWFCKSKGIASARLAMRHQTSYEQLLASVSPATRQAYLQLLGQ